MLQHRAVCLLPICLLHMRPPTDSTHSASCAHPGVVPLLVALLAVRSAPVVRQALGVLANLCLGFPPGMQAVMRAGAGPAALALLQPHHHHHSQVAGAGGSASAGGAAEAGGGGASAGGGTGGGGSPIVLSGSDGEGGSSRENSSGGEDKGAGAARQRHRSSSGAGASTSTGTLIEDTGVGSPTSGTPPRLPSPEPEGHDAHSGAADASSSSPAAGETAVSPAAAAPSVAERACLLLANLASGGRASKEALLGAGAVPALLCHLRGAVPQLLAEAAEASTSSSGLASAGAQAAGSSSIGRKALAVRQQRAAAAAAAAAALANLCLREPAAGAQLASAGGVGLLAALLTPEVQAVHPEVVARVAHALGSAAAAGCAACQDALLEPLPPFNAASTAADSAAGPQEPAGTSSSTSGTGSSALERLVGLARVRPPVPAVLPEVLRALGNAAQAHGRGREALRRAGGLDALVAALQVGCRWPSCHVCLLPALCPFHDQPLLATGQGGLEALALTTASCAKPLLPSARWATWPRCVRRCWRLSRRWTGAPPARRRCARPRLNGLCCLSCRRRWN